MRDKIYGYIASVLNKAPSGTFACFLPPAPVQSQTLGLTQMFNAFFCPGAKVFPLHRDQWRAKVLYEVLRVQS